MGENIGSHSSLLRIILIKHDALLIASHSQLRFAARQDEGDNSDENYQRDEQPNNIGTQYIGAKSARDEDACDSGSLACACNLTTLNKALNSRTNAWPRVDPVTGFWMGFGETERGDNPEDCGGP